MNNDETKRALLFLTEMWPGNISAALSRRYGELFSGLEFGPLMAVLDGLLENGGDFRPGLAKIRRPFEPDALEQASADFKAVLGVFWRPVEERYRELSPRAAETVRRMGGWETLRHWHPEKRHFQMRDFERVWKDVAVHDQSKALRAIASPLLKSLTGVAN